MKDKEADNPTLIGKAMFTLASPLSIPIALASLRR
jgi:hypothetical protein